MSVNYVLKCAIGELPTANEDKTVNGNCSLCQINTAISQYVKLRLSYKVAYTMRLSFRPLKSPAVLKEITTGSFNI